MKKLLVLCFALALIFVCSGCVANSTDENVSIESIGALTESGDLSDSDNSIDLTDSDDSPAVTNSNDSASSENSLSSTKSDISTEPDNSTDSSKTDGSGDSDDSTTNNSGSKLCFHSYKKATCVAPKTCTKCGKTSGKALGHTYSDATCDAPKTCSVCGGTTGSALGHKYITGECVRVVNGKECGHYSEAYCPKLYLSGDMSKITDPAQTSKKIECNIDYEYRSSDDNFNGSATIKIQGSSSTKYAKKNYTINFYEDSSYSSKMKIDVGFGAQSKYCLKANWVDKTHSRNVVTAKLAGEMQAKYGLFESAPNNGAIDGFPVEVYINGEFHGLYTMNIPKDEWMFNMDGDNPNHIVICGENWKDPVLFKSVPTDLNDWTVEVGPEDDVTLQKVQRLVDFVLNSSDSEFKANFSQYLNLDSTLNYYVMMHCGWMSDNRGKNMLLATYDGKIWYPSLYDLDTTWGTHWTGGSLYNYSSGFLDNGGSVLWQRMEKLYKKEIAARYFELRQDVLSEEHIMDAFNSFYHNNKIIAETDEVKQGEWISLITLVLHLLEICIDLLGFSAPDRM